MKHRPSPLQLHPLADSQPPVTPALKAPAGNGTRVEGPSAAGNFIVALARDLDGNDWVGTEDNGVLRGTPQGEWTQFTTKDGLGDDNGYALCCDRLGRIWAGQLNHGVSVFNGETWKSYDVLDGPLGERIFDIACCPTDGDVWLATSAGLSRYSEAASGQLSDPDAPSVRVTQLAVGHTSPAPMACRPNHAAEQCRETISCNLSTRLLILIFLDCRMHWPHVRYFTTSPLHHFTTSRVSTILLETIGLKRGTRPG